MFLICEKWIAKYGSESLIKGGGVKEREGHIRSKSSFRLPIAFIYLKSLTAEKQRCGLRTAREDLALGAYSPYWFCPKGVPFSSSQYLHTKG